MALTDQQRTDLRKEGYVRLPGIVPRSSVDAALRAINAWMGRGMDPDQMEIYSSRSFCPDDRDDPVFLDLYRSTPIAEAVESALGPSSIAPVERAQISLRFPLPSGHPQTPPGPHLDGVSTPTNGVEPGRVHNFAALVGIYLQDVEEPFAGNFTVWPKSHAQYAAYFAEHGPLALLDGMPPVSLGPPEQLLGKAGDAFLCHYLLGHGAAENHSPRIRYAVFFRLKHRDHDRLGYGPMTAPWLGWTGI